MRTPDFSNELPVPRRPHNVAPALASVRLVLIAHQWRPRAPGSDAGLSIIVNSTMRVLRRAGIECECWPARDAKDIAEQLDTDRWESSRPVTHVVINTYGFLGAEETAQLSMRFRNIEFVNLNHSGQSFLQIDPPANRNIKKIIKLQLSTHNVRAAGNSLVFKEFARDDFGADVLYLPNLYDVTGFRADFTERRHSPNPIRIGTFGATRPAKNQFVALHAALGMARHLDVPLEWHVNGQRFDSEPSALMSRRQFLEGNPRAALVEHPWQTWADFRAVVEAMDVLLMPSFDETFCCVVADGIAVGVPSVTTAAMPWTPRHWWCEPHDPASVKRVGLSLVYDRATAAREGREALAAFVRDGTRYWIDYLTGETI